MKRQRKKRLTSDKEILEKNIQKIDLNFCENITVDRKQNSKGEMIPYISFFCPSNHLIELLSQNIHKNRPIKCAECKKSKIENNRKFKTNTIENIQLEVNKVFPYKYQIIKLHPITKGRKLVDGFCNDCKENFEKRDLYKIIIEKQIVCSKNCRTKKRREGEKDKKINFYQEKININPNRKHEIFINDIEYIDEKVWVYTTCTKHHRIKKEDNFFIGSTVNKHVPCKGCIGENKLILNNRRLTEEIAVEKAKLKINNPQFIPFKAIKEQKSSYWNIFFNCALHPNVLGKKILGQITEKTIPCKLCNTKNLKNNAEKFLELASVIHSEYKYNEKEIRKAFQININKIPVICNKPRHGVFYTNYEQHIKYKKGFCDKCITSVGQQQTGKILKQSDIKFEQNLSFKNLGKIYPEFYHEEKDIKFNLKNLRPDFYLPNHNFLVEYDGIYHFDIKKHRKKKTFYKTIKNDYLKNKYAIRNNINILRISCLSDKNQDYDYAKNLILKSIFSDKMQNKLYNKELFIKKSNMYLIVIRRIAFKKNIKIRNGNIKK